MKAKVIGAMLGILLLPISLSAGEQRYTFRDERVEIVVQQMEEWTNQNPLLDITFTNTSRNELVKVLLELRFYDESGKLIKEAEVPVFAFGKHIGRVKYSAPPFSKLEVGPVHYEVVP